MLYINRLFSLDCISESNYNHFYLKLELYHKEIKINDCMIKDNGKYYGNVNDGCIPGECFGPNNNNFILNRFGINGAKERLYKREDIYYQYQKNKKKDCAVM